MSVGKENNDDGIANTLNIAGYTTLGVGRGFFKMIVPAAVMGLAWGMTKKVIKTADKFGRVE